MSKITLNDLASLENQASAITTINNNHTAITNALQNTLSRDGTSPNEMGADFDMNSNRILNLPRPVSAGEPARLSDLTDATLSAAFTVGAGQIYSGTNGRVLYDNDGTLGEYNITGTGSVVMSSDATLTSPSLVTPDLGVASATSINKVHLTAPATSSTLTIQDGKTATVNKSLTLDGSDGTIITFQGSDTYVGRATTDTLTNKTLTSPVINGTVTGTAVGTTANKLVQLDSSAKLPAVDGSQLTNLPSGTSAITQYSTRATAAAATIAGSVNIIQTSGYSSVGDNGDATYVRASAPTLQNGTWNDTLSVGRTMGAGGGITNGGFRFTAPVTAKLSTVKITVNAVSVSGTWRCFLYTDSGSHPGSQINFGNGNSVTISSAGDYTFTFSQSYLYNQPGVQSGTPYWLIFSPTTTGPSMTVATVTNDASYGSGRNDTLSSITTTDLPNTEDWKVQINYDVPADMFQSADGAFWQISSQPIKPESFGAVGDGSTDDTNALYKWLKASGGKAAWAMPNKVYKTNALSISLTENNVPLYIDFRSSTLRGQTTDTAPLLTIENPHGFVETTGYADNMFEVRNLQLDANLKNSYGLKIHGWQQGCLRNILVRNATADGISMVGEPGYGIYYCMFENVYSLSNGGDGWNLSSINNSGGYYMASDSFVNCRSISNTGMGWRMDYVTGVWLGCEAEANGSAGFGVNHSIDVVFLGCYTELNSSPDLSFFSIGIAQCAGVKIIGGRQIGAISSDFKSGTTNFIQCGDASGNLVYFSNGLNLSSMSVGASNSGGTGFALLRIPN